MINRADPFVRFVLLLCSLSLTFTRQDFRRCEHSRASPNTKKIQGLRIGTLFLYPQMIRFTASHF